MIWRADRRAAHIWAARPGPECCALTFSFSRVKTLVSGIRWIITRAEMEPIAPTKKGRRQAQALRVGTPSQLDSTAPSSEPKTPPPRMDM